MVRKKQKPDRQAFKKIAEILALIHEPDEMCAFLDELLTPAEVHDIALRWKLLHLLADGVSQRKIAEDLKISLCKITRGSKILKQQGAVTTRLLQNRKR